MMGQQVRQPRDLTGRIDVFVFGVLERLIQRDPIGRLLWGRGLDAVVETVVAQSLPRRPLWRRLCT